MENRFPQNLFGSILVAGAMACPFAAGEPVSAANGQGEPAAIISGQPGAASAPGPADIARKRLFRKPAPLQHLNFSARQGFSLRMVSNEEVTAEIRNGAGRVLARASYTVEAGDWKLRPKNLAPGLYTVILKTGAQLRAMRMKIEDTDRGPGSPEWILERVPADSAVAPTMHGA